MLYFSNVSTCLADKGRLLLFWTHGIGYYFEECISSILHLKMRTAISMIAAVLCGLAQSIFGFSIVSGVTWRHGTPVSRVGSDHVVTYRYTKKLAARNGIRIQSLVLSGLCRKYYANHFFCLPLVFNIVGTRTNDKALARSTQSQ